MSDQLVTSLTTTILLLIAFVTVQHATAKLQKRPDAIQSDLEFYHRFCVLSKSDSVVFDEVKFVKCLTHLEQECERRGGKAATSDECRWIREREMPKMDPHRFKRQARGKNNNNGNDNNGRNNRDKNQRCDKRTMSDDDYEQCKKDTDCQGLPKNEQKQCRKELRCASSPDEQQKKACMAEESCNDLETEDEQNECRAEEQCAHLNASKKDRCKKGNRVNCNDQTTKDERDMCKAERQCAYVFDTREKRECVNTALANCGQMEEGVEQDACFNKRKTRRADKAKVEALNNRLNRRAMRYRILQNQKVVNKEPRPDVAKPIAGQKKQIDEQTVNDRAGEQLFGGDMELTVRQVNDLETLMDVAGDVPRRRKRKVGKGPIYWLWDTLPISYKFDPWFPAGSKQVVKDAIKLWESETCVRWEENGKNPDSIQFYNGGGCSSYVGRTGGLQEISIAVPGCDYIGIVSHEIGHSLGFMHEQARPDQSKYLNVVYDNISPFRWNNFLPADTTEVNTYGYAYDYGSVMHYNSYGFAVDDKRISLETTDPFYQQTIGQRVGPSFIDVAQVNKAYCDSVCPTKLACQHGGYTDPNACARCKCPSGFGGVLCEKVQTTTCGGYIKLDGSLNLDTIQSPNYPSQFPIPSECAWLIETEPGFKVQLTFVEQFDLSCKESCDESHVEIKKGDDWTRTGYRFCCGVKPVSLFESVDNKLVVMFRSNEGSPSAGFKAEVKTTMPQVTTTTKASTTTTATTTTTTPTTTTTTPSTTKTAASTTTTAASTTATTTTTGAPVTNKPGCQCSEWGAWQGTCTQDCGGCGTRIRKRSCSTRACYDTERQRCNHNACVGQSWLWKNWEFHLLFDGCCIGLAKNPAGQCTGDFAELFGSFLPAFDTVKRLQADNPFGK